MIPTIRYTASPAGRIAYTTAGDGPPLLCDSGWVTHLRGQLDLFSFAAFAAELARRFTVIRYDKPGCGLSDTAGADLSFDGQVAAALAVADAAGAGRLSLFGASQGGQVAAALAASAPDRVTSLVLYGTCANGAGLAPAEVRDSIVALIRAHWGLGSKVLTGIFIPDPSPEEVEQFGRLQRAGASAELAARLLQTYYETDVSALLPRVRARTAVLHRETDPATPFRLGREVAALVPGSVLVPLPGPGHLYYHGDWRAVLDAVLGFLAEADSSGPASATVPVTTGPATTVPATTVPATTGPADGGESAGVGPAGGGPEARLTPRELEVAALVAEGLTSQAIAERLTIAPRTAEAHVENIRRKLGVRSRAQIAAWAARHGVSGGHGASPR